MWECSQVTVDDGAYFIIVGNCNRTTNCITMHDSDVPSLSIESFTNNMSAKLRTAIPNSPQTPPTVLSGPNANPIPNPIPDSNQQYVLHCHLCAIVVRIQFGSAVWTINL